ncbi:MAG: cation transporter [Planctomycetes bacterium]|nr:cation transporter [Planctomycetota bacterium]
MRNGAQVMHECCTNTDAAGHADSKGRRVGPLATGGSVLSALASSACCWIPLSLIALGVSAGGVSAWFEQYRWLFLSLTAILLSTGFYFAYFRTPRCAPGSSCATPNRSVRRFNRAVLWVAAIVVFATAAFPKYVGALIPQRPPMQAAPTAELTTVSLGIEGMTCQACAVHLRSALADVAGVLDVRVSYEDSAAAISFETSAPPSETDLTNAVERAGYKADTSAMSP